MEVHLYLSRPYYEDHFVNTSRDLHTANIAFTDTQIQHLSDSDVLQYVGKPEQWPINPLTPAPHEQGVPRYHVWPLASVEPEIDSSPDVQVKLLDFSNSFLSDQPPPNLSVPMSYCPPEVALGVALDHRVDLWALGCLI
ncbi:hypothetical protein B9Z65_6281 [Elsinoe australis]|uniref:Protein kinase domain-containing protein n=1 Tax=Elsinoe australis TaxID=40998 RepID=A0A2P8A870_9PEZI|nr:hypothetical protein B9Z65_6281 [Elsinoe australis]